MVLSCVIVDDNPRFVDAASSLLEGQGISILGVAATVEDSVREIGRLRPDVALVDINLGPESGFDVIRAVDRAGDPPKFILISTHDESDFGELIEASSAIGFIPKGELSGEAIRALLERAEGG